eukprot:893170-Rhodomonas_salina.2
MASLWRVNFDSTKITHSTELEYHDVERAVQDYTDGVCCSVATDAASQQQASAECEKQAPLGTGSNEDAKLSSGVVGIKRSLDENAEHCISNKVIAEQCVQTRPEKCPKVEGSAVVQVKTEVGPVETHPKRGAEGTESVKTASAITVAGHAQTPVHRINGTGRPRKHAARYIAQNSLLSAT